MTKIRENVRPKGNLRAVLALVAVVASMMLPIAIAAPAAAAQPTGRMAQFDADMLQLVNDARVSNGVAPLQSDSGLVGLSAWWSKRMADGATAGNLQHNPDATTMLADYGAGNWSFWGENVAKFFPGVTAKQIFDLYMGSPGHRANILQPGFHYIGLGTVDGPYGTFNTMEFTDKIESGGCHPFYDIDATFDSCQDIVWLSQQNITTPVGGQFNPFQQVTRGQSVAFLYRLTHPGQTPPACQSKPFSDIATSNVFCGNITWAVSVGVTQGYTDGTFQPGSPVTRGAMSAYLYRAVNGHTAPPCTTQPFADVPVGNVFCGAITWMANNHISGDVGGGRFAPTAVVDRQAMATMLHRTSALI